MHKEICFSGKMIVYQNYLQKGRIY